MNETEKSYLLGLLESIQQYENYNQGFTILGKYEENNPLNELIYYNDIDSWINNINYLNEQVVQFGKKALLLIEDIPEKDFGISGEEFKEAYIETENMLFRISILWDLLAQLFNCVFKLNEKIDKIHHFNFFKKYQEETVKTFEYHAVSSEIFMYFNEDDDFEEQVWKGNFNYCNALRNSFTHRLNPHIVNFNNGIFHKANNRGVNFPVYPLYELKRMTEDFVKVNYFASKLLNDHVAKNKLSIG